MVKVTSRKDPVTQFGETKRQVSAFLNSVVTVELLRIMQEAGEMVLEETIPLTPEDTGALRESGHVTVKRTTSTGRPGASASVAFGGLFPVAPTRNAPTGFVDYAEKVHEDLEATYRVGQAKFLLEGSRRALPKVRAHVQRRLAALGKGKGKSR